jgi:hypothetical protein
MTRTHLQHIRLGLSFLTNKNLTSRKTRITSTYYFFVGYSGLLKNTLKIKVGDLLK